MLMYQYWFINCNKYTILMKNINNGEVGSGYMGSLYIIFVIFLKIQNYSKKVYFKK